MYVSIENLEIYKETRKLNKDIWEIYSNMKYNEKKIIGDQIVRSSDSISANIAEGYGRYHYLDRIKFYYNSRGSLLETKHWISLLRERNLVNKPDFDRVTAQLALISIKLNNLIKSNKESKKLSIS